MNKFLDKVIAYGGHLSGNNTRRLGRDLQALQRFEHLGEHGIPHSTITHAEGLLGQAKSNTLKARIGTIGGAAAAGGAGYFGTKKYHQYQDNKILERIDSMYQHEL